MVAITILGILNTTLIQDYLVAMKAVGVDVVELGFRMTDQQGFKGACAYTTDSFVRTLEDTRGHYILCDD